MTSFIPCSETWPILYSSFLFKLMSKWLIFLLHKVRPTFIMTYFSSFILTTFSKSSTAIFLLILIAFSRSVSWTEFCIRCSLRTRLSPKFGRRNQKIRTLLEIINYIWEILQSLLFTECLLTFLSSGKKCSLSTLS